MFIMDIRDKLWWAIYYMVTMIYILLLEVIKERLSIIEPDKLLIIKESEWTKNGCQNSLPILKQSTEEICFIGIDYKTIDYKNGDE